MSREKVFIRRLHYSSSCTTYLDYDSFSDIWSTVGCFGFSPYISKVRIPYKLDFVYDFFGDNLIYNSSYFIWNDDRTRLKGIQNGNRFLRTDISFRKVYPDEFINKLMKENFDSYKNK